MTRESIVLDRSNGARTFRFTAVSMGNPHAVIFVDDAGEDLMALATKYGPALETAPTFPRRTNVEFARVRKDGEIDLVVWERGCGITLACGTGACATGVAAAVEERLPRGREILVHLPGGTLGITVAADDSGVRMRGPARTVFRSEPRALEAPSAWRSPRSAARRRAGMRRPGPTWRCSRPTIRRSTSSDGQSSAFSMGSWRRARELPPGLHAQRQRVRRRGGPEADGSDFRRSQSRILCFEAQAGHSYVVRPVPDGTFRVPELC